MKNRDNKKVQNELFAMWHKYYADSRRSAKMIKNKVINKDKDNERKQEKQK